MYGILYCCLLIVVSHYTGIVVGFIGRVPQRWMHFPYQQAPIVVFRPCSDRSTICFVQATNDMNWDPKSAPKLDFDEDFYSVLEVDPAISSKDMKKAYYKIVFKYHPDNKETPEAKALCNKQMMVINAAYKVLKDADARAAYDRKRKVGVYGGAASKAGGRSTSSSSSSSSGRSSSSSSSSSGNRYSSTQSSSGGAGSDPFGGFWGSNSNNNAEYTTTDSLGDIFSELWSEIRKGEGKNIVGDVLEFLEDQVRVLSAYCCSWILVCCVACTLRRMLVQHRVVSFYVERCCVWTRGPVDVDLFLMFRPDTLCSCQMPYTSATDARNAYDTWSSSSSSAGSSSSGSGRGSGSGSGGQPGDDERTQARVDSAVRIMQSAIQNLKVGGGE